VAATRERAPAWEEFEAALDDDFSTPAALAILHEWRACGQLDLLRRGLAIFGLEVASAEEAPEEVRRLADERQAARERGDFETADRLRAEIDRLGWEVQDVPGGYRLVRKK
jgi:cysteinyl-tRNA synthetase